MEEHRELLHGPSDSAERLDRITSIAQRNLARKYWKEKVERIQQQERDERESHLFDGVVVYFQGYTEGMTSYDLKKKVIAHGGTCLAFLNGGATHVVGRNLSGSNNEAFLKRSKAKWFVTPQWIMQSVEQGRRLAEGDFLAWEDKTNNTLQRFFKPLETEDSPMECREPTIETNEDSRTLPKNQKKRDQSKTEIKHKTAFLANKLRKVPNDKLHSRLENVLDHLPKAHDSETLHH